MTKEKDNLAWLDDLDKDLEEQKVEKPKPKEIIDLTKVDEPKPTPAPANIEPVVDRILQKVQQLQNKGSGLVQTYVPLQIIGDLLYIILLKKYSNKCAFFYKATELRSERKLQAGLEFYPFNMRNNKLFDNSFPPHQIKNMGERLKECLEKGVDLIVIPLSIYVKKDGHANIIAIRPKEHRVERFEPHGQAFEYKNSDELDKVINMNLKRLFEIELRPYYKDTIGNLKYVEPNEICPMRDGFQGLEGQLSSLDIEGGGYCLLWSCFLMEMLFMNPTKSTKEIIDYVLEITQQDPKYLRQVIRGYVKETEEELNILLRDVKKYSTFKYENIRKHDWNSESNYLRYSDQLDQLAIDLVRSQKQSSGKGLYCECVGKKKCNKPIYKGVMKNNIKGKGNASGKPLTKQQQKQAEAFDNELHYEGEGASFGDLPEQLPAAEKKKLKKKKTEEADAFIAQKQAQHKQQQQGTGKISHNNIMSMGGGIHHHYHFHEAPMEGHGNAFTDFFTKTIPKAAKKAGDDIKDFGTKTLPSTLIHQGIPVAGSVLGGVAGEALAPEGGPVSGIVGSQLGKQAGNMIADKVGKETGYGLKLKKGSQEAKDYMAKIRAMRGKKKQ